MSSRFFGIQDFPCLKVGIRELKAKSGRYSGLKVRTGCGMPNITLGITGLREILGRDYQIADGVRNISTLFNPFLYSCMAKNKMLFVLIYSALQCFNQGVVVTSQPLQDDELFEVRLDSKVPRWLGSLDIGATTVPADQLQFPSTMTSCSQGTTFVLTSNIIVNNGKEMTRVSKNLEYLSVSGLGKSF